MTFPSPRFVNIQEKKLIGMHVTMTIAENKTFELWKGFMPRRKEITNNLNSELLSMQVYDSSFNFMKFDLHQTFAKWAAVEVSDHSFVPEGMECFTIPTGSYAVFPYKGRNTDTEIFRYIFEKWLPASEFKLDHRPHFEILGEKYKNNDPESEEEIWIPIV